MSQGVWVFAEQRGGELQEISLELLSEGRKIAGQLGEELCAVLLGYQIGGLTQVLGHYGADKVYLVEDESLDVYTTLSYTNVLAGLIGRYSPSVFLIGATSLGKDLAPRVATRVRTGLIADCVILKVDGSRQLLVTRPVYTDKLYSTLVCPTARRQMITVRPGAMDVEDPIPSRQAEVIQVEAKDWVGDAITKVVGFTKADPRTIDISEAQFIVAGGRGVNGKEGFRLLEELADALGASIAGSRAAVDAGWIPFERQVGQTGKSVIPKVYIACGISGAIQHTAGIKESTLIIAINSDRNAPIFKSAKLRIVGDLHQIVPAITKRLQETMRPQPENANPLGGVKSGAW